MTKQQLIVQFALKNGNTFSIKDLVGLSGIDTYYCNSAKHIGEVVKTMLNKGILSKVKKGTYKLSEQTTKNLEQINLF